MCHTDGSRQCCKDGGEQQITCTNLKVFSHCSIWPPATEEHINTGSTHQLHAAEYKQKQKGEDQSYLQGTEIPHILL